MDFSIDAAEFRPITIKLESQDDYDKMCYILEQVANNRINHPHNAIEAAKSILKGLTEIGEANV